MNGIAARIALVLAIGAGLPLLAAALAWLPLSRQLALQDAAQRLQQQALQAAQALDARLSQVEFSAAILARDILDAPPEAEALARRLQHRIEVNPDLHAAQILVEDGPGHERLGFHLSQRGSTLRIRDFVAERYGFSERPWYVGAMAQGRGHWTQAYFNHSAGGRDTLTYHAPVQWPQPGLRGLLSLDMALDRLDVWARDSGLIPPLTARRDAPVRSHSMVLLDGSGRVLVHSDPSLHRGLRAPAAEVMLAGRGLIEASFAEAPGAVRTLREPAGATYLSLRQQIGARPLWLLLSVPEQEILAPLDPLQTLALPLGLFAAMLLALALFAARRLARPLERLARAADRMAAGDFDTAIVASRRRDEIGRLERALEHARLAVSGYARVLADAAERDRRLGSELELARQIQRAMLPRDRVFLSAHAALHLAGALQPAKAVGGDFYGFYPLGAGEVGFLIGDVSDKGVPSALFAARLNALLLNHARQAGDAASTLAAAAAEIFRSNETGLFATVLIGSVVLETGAMQLASAGHDAPLLLHADGRREWLPVEPGPALGFEEQVDYALWRGELPLGAQLLLYTDGVSEAMTAQYEEFGSERIEIALERHEPRSPQRTVLAVVSEVQAFVDGAEPSDDLTLLVLGRYEREL